MSAISETAVLERQILLVGPYGVLGTRVIDAVAENPKWGTTVLIAGPHMNFPALGRLHKEGSGYSWSPVVFTDQRDENH